MSGFYIDIEDFKDEVVRLYRERLARTEHRSINCGELVRIDGLKKKELRGLYNELCEEKGAK